MLILTRCPGESNVIHAPIGEQTKVTVLGLKTNHVHIDKQAPAEVQIRREELYESTTT